MGRNSPLLSARVGTLPTSVSQRAQPPDAHEDSPSPPSLACPLLLRPCGHGCVWWLVGGQLCQGARQGLFAW